MVSHVKQVKLNSILNLFTQMFVNVNNLIKDHKDGKKETKIFYKEANEKFTNFDWTIQKMIENHLDQNFPNIKFIGEENTKEETVPKEFSEFLQKVDEIKLTPFSDADKFGSVEFDEDQLCIYCDPIDSTSSFLKSNYGPVTVLIGIVHKGVPISGLVHFPLYENKEAVSFISLPGVGVFRVTYGDEGHITDKVVFNMEKVDPILKQDFNFTITASRENKTMTKILSFFPGCDVVRVSGLGNKALISILQDYFYFAPEKGLGYWDVCGPHALIRELGGGCFYVDGTEIFYPEDPKQKTLPLCFCMSLHKDKVAKFVDLLSTEKIEI